MLLLDLFVSQNKLTEIEAKEIDADASAHEEFLVDDFLIKKHITSEEITEVRSILHGLPIYTKEVVENKDLTAYISVIQSKQLLAVPLEMKDGVLLVGIVDPEHANVLDSLQFLFGASHQAYKVYLISYDAYRNHFGLKPGDAIAEPAVSVTTQVDQPDISYIAKDEERYIAREKMSAKLAAVTYFTKAINHLDDITNPDLKETDAYKTLLSSVYRSWIMAEYDTQNFPQCIPILELDRNHFLDHIFLRIPS
jgi:hypothetical protein